MICAGCRASISDHVKFCPKCGTKAEAVTAQAPQTKRCPMCGVDNSLSANFCEEDGHPLELVEQQSLLEVKEPTSGLFCSTCGTSYPLTVRFCRNDGTPLEGRLAPLREAAQSSVGERTGRPPESDEANPPADEEAKRPVLVDVAAQPDVEIGTGAVRRPLGSWQWLVAAGVVVLLAGGAGFLYFSGLIGKNTVTVKRKLDAELNAQGLNTISVEIGRDWVATVSGFVDNQVDKGRVLGIVESNKDVKDVEDRIDVVPAQDESVKAVAKAPSSTQSPTMRKVDELIKQGAFE